MSVHAALKALEYLVEDPILLTAAFALNALRGSRARCRLGLECRAALVLNFVGGVRR